MNDHWKEHFKLQRQPNRWSCLPTALAILLGVDVQEIFEFLGHDGSEIRWPSLPEPWCRRSFHPQEVSHYALTKGYALVPFAPKMGYPPSGQMTSVRCMEDDRFQSITDEWGGIFLGLTESGHSHAIAVWDGEYVDPTSGGPYIGQFQVDSYLALIPIVM